TLDNTLMGGGVADSFPDHHPAERQSRRLSRGAGVDIPPQTLGRSMAAAIDLASPIAREIRNETCECVLLATDPTGLPVLDRDHPHGIRNGTMWCWIGDNKWVTFFYTPIGDSKSVRDFLGEDLRSTAQCERS